MSRALDGAEGVGNIEITAGVDDFTVHFDSKKTSSEAIVEALKAGGESGAKVKS